MKERTVTTPNNAAEPPGVGLPIAIDISLEKDAMPEKMTVKDFFAGFYGLGIIAFTLMWQREVGWVAGIGWGLIWPVTVVKWVIDARHLWNLG